MNKRKSRRASMTKVRPYATRRGRRVLATMPPTTVIDANEWLHQMIDKYRWTAQARFIKRDGQNPLSFVVEFTAIGPR